MIAFSRQQPLAPETLDANRLIGGMTDILNRTLRDAVAVETVLAAGLWLVWADAAQMESALVNLAVNARDAMPGGGRLTVETSNAHADAAYARENDVAEGQYVVIAVTDTGSGMTSEVVARVRTFLHDEGIGEGHRARPVASVRVHQAVPGQRQNLFRAGAWNDCQAVFAAFLRGERAGGCSHGERAGRPIAKRRCGKLFWSSRTKSRCATSLSMRFGSSATQCCMLRAAKKP